MPSIRLAGAAPRGSGRQTPVATEASGPQPRTTSRRLSTPPTVSAEPEAPPAVRPSAPARASSRTASAAAGSPSAHASGRDAKHASSRRSAEEAPARSSSRSSKRGSARTSRRGKDEERVGQSQRRGDSGRKSRGLLYAGLGLAALGLLVLFASGGGKAKSRKPLSEPAPVAQAGAYASKAEAEQALEHAQTLFREGTVTTDNAVRRARYDEVISICERVLSSPVGEKTLQRAGQKLSDAKKCRDVR